MKLNPKIILALVAMLALASCSKLQNTAVLTPKTAPDVVHPAGWTTPTSADFHGTYIKTHNYNLGACVDCHGSDYKGGLTGVSCYKCHTEPGGPTACNTCHGSKANPAPPNDLAGNTSTSVPGVGAHQVHLLGSASFDSVSCSACHTVPDSAGPGLHPTGSAVAALNFSGVAVTETNTPGSRFYDSTAATVVPKPSFSFQTLQCQNTYCHGNFKGGNNFSPTWTIVDGSQDSCGSCHGIPPNDATHQGKGITLQKCYYCHSPMIGPDGVIANDSMHVTGKLVLYGKTVSSW